MRRRFRNVNIIETRVMKFEFPNQFKNSNEKREYTETHSYAILFPLNPSVALYGGRTGNTVQKNEKIKYVYLTSFY